MPPVVMKHGLEKLGPSWAERRKAFRDGEVWKGPLYFQWGAWVGLAGQVQYG